MVIESIGTELVTWAVGLPSISVVIAYGISIIRRKVSSDQKALHEDSSYQNMLESYKKERDETKLDRDRVVERMFVIEQERNEAVSKVGKLSAEVEFLSSQVVELKGLVEKLSTSLDLAREEMHRFAVDNAKLAAHVSYLEEIIEQTSDKRLHSAVPSIRRSDNKSNP
jgi:chromosome segregation ATPase